MTRKPKQHSKQALFIWQGSDESGHKHSGEIQAVSLIMAKAQLRKQGIIARKIHQKKQRPFGLGGKRISTKEIALFTRQLSTMLQAGVPLVQSLNIVAEGSEQPSLQKIVLSIRNDVADGNMLSTGLRKHPAYFDPLFCNLIEAGEHSGSLDQMLDRVALYKEKTDRIKAKIKKALYYPIAVMAIGVSVMLILLLKVVPQFEALFNSFDAQLPVVTQTAIDMSVFVQQQWWAIGSLLVFGPLLLTKTYRSSERFAYRVDQLILRVPVLGQIVVKSAIARFTRTLSTSFTAGVPLVESMASSAGAAGNRVFSRAIFQARDSLATGQSLNFALKATAIFPAMVTQMVAIGEESGSLALMLEKIASFYEEDVDDAVDNMTTLLEPMVVTLLGVMVGGLVLAMYLPIFEMGRLF